MRRVTFTAEQFDTFVFQHVALGTAKNDDEAETAVRLMRLLKDPAKTVEAPLTAREQQQIDEGERVFLFRRLIHPSATFELQEDEWKLMDRRLKEAKSRVSFIALEEFMGVLKVVEKAEEFTPPPKAEAVAPVS